MAAPFVVMGLLFCAFQAIRSTRLLTSALWLAGASALVALLMYLLGAPELAVIELSVGAGLVTILLVFAINIAGHEIPEARPIIPKPLAWGVISLAILLLAWLNLPALGVGVHAFEQETFATVFWQDRRLDTLLQLVLLFAGVLGLLANGSAGNNKKEDSL